VTIYGIATKFGTTMCSYATYLCTKFQVNRITHLHFKANFTLWWKKTEAIATNLVSINEPPNTIDIATKNFKKKYCKMKKNWLQVGLNLCSQTIEALQSRDLATKPATTLPLFSTLYRNASSGKP